MLKTTIRPSAPNTAVATTAKRPRAPDSFARQCLEAAIRAVCIVAVLALVLSLMSACGPGTGGTGVGPVSSAAPAPTISFSGSVTLGSTTAALPAAPVVSPVPVASPGAAACAVNCGTTTVSLVLEAERVLLASSCFNFVSQGPLVVATSGPTVLAGAYQTFSTRNGQTTTSSVPANLVLQFANGQADSASVTVSVQGSTGAVLLAPVSLPRTTGAQPVGAGSSGVTTNQSQCS